MLAAGVCVVVLLHAPMLLMETLLMSFRIAFLVQVTSDVCGLSASVDVFICRFVRINRTNACELNVHRSALQVAAETIAQYGAEDAVARLVALSLGYASKIPRVRPLSAPPLLRAHVRNTCAPASPPTEVQRFARMSRRTDSVLAFEAEPHRPLVVDACQRVRYPAHRSPCFPCCRACRSFRGVRALSA